MILAKSANQISKIVISDCDLLRFLFSLLYHTNRRVHGMLLKSKSVDVCVVKGLFEILEFCLLGGEGVECLRNIFI